MLAIADHHRRVTTEGEQRDGFVAGCWAAEEINPTPLGSRVLIAQQRQNSTALHDLLHSRRTSVLGENELSVVATEFIDKVIQVRIVHLPRDGVAWHSQQARDIAAHLKIPIVARHCHQRTIINQVICHLLDVANVNVLPPIGVVNLSRRLSDFAGHQNQVIPHLPRHGFNALVIGVGENA